MNLAYRTEISSGQERLGKKEEAIEILVEVMGVMLEHCIHKTFISSILNHYSLKNWGQALIALSIAPDMESVFN